MKAALNFLRWPVAPKARTKFLIIVKMIESRIIRSVSRAAKDLIVTQWATVIPTFGTSLRRK